jgi:hypothetical protein
MQTVLLVKINIVTRLRLSRRGRYGYMAAPMIYLMCKEALVGDSPRGPLKQRGNPHLKPATSPKHKLPNPAGNGPRRRDPDGPSRRPS